MEDVEMSQTSNPIVLYDGICGLCDRFVQFVLKRDRRDCFRFAALQSEFAEAILARHGIRARDLDTFYLVRSLEQPGESLLCRSDAARAVFSELGGLWKVPAVFLGLLPRGIRNWGYDWIARRRYRFFGKFDVCPLPDPKDRHKFLDQSRPSTSP
jgi:predicted DCC family thiol-disulfide oxidoreductase YuxK